MPALVIGVVLLKGGASKTTAAMGLAAAAGYNGHAALLDSDPQGSALHWAALAEASGRPVRFSITGAAPGRTEIPRRIGPLARENQIVIIDAAPPGHLPDVRAVIEASHRVVIPVPPQLADLARVQATAAIAAEYGKPARVALTQVRGGIAEREAAIRALAGWGVPLYSTEMPLAVDIQRAYGTAVTSGPLLRFGVDLLTEIVKEARSA